MNDVTQLREITDLGANDTARQARVAKLLVLGFADHAPTAWPDLEAAAQEVEESLQEGRISRIAPDQEGQVIGWIGGISQCDGHTWELHTLVVHTDHRGTGVGTALVRALRPKSVKLARRPSGSVRTMRTAGHRSVEWISTPMCWREQPPSGICIATHSSSI